MTTELFRHTGQIALGREISIPKNRRVLITGDRLLELSRPSLNSDFDAPEVTAHKDSYGESDPTEIYLQELGHQPLLTFEQEQELARAIKKGKSAKNEIERNGIGQSEKNMLQKDIEAGNTAREQMFEANRKLVVSIAKLHRGRGVPFLDLIQEGNMGLFTAVGKFDYRRGFKFSTYATYWIRQSVTRAVKEQGRTIRIPEHVLTQIRKFYKASQRLSEDLGREPTLEEIAGDLRLPVEKVGRLRAYANHTLSLDAPAGRDGESKLLDFIPDETSPIPEDRLLMSPSQKDIELVFSTLTPKQVKILILKYGFYGERAHTLEEIGEKFDLTKERIRQIIAEVYLKLRNPKNDAGNILRKYL